MNDDSHERDAGTRESPVGSPVVRGDEAITGEHADDALGFDPDDPEDLSRAVSVVREFADQSPTDDSIDVLAGAAACATLVRGEGSYTAAADRAGTGVTVAFVRKWARVHDLPRPVRKHVAVGSIAPTAAKHIARVSGPGRYDLAWAVLDHDLTVRELRSIVGDVVDGQSIEATLLDHGVDPGTIELDLSKETYHELRHRATREDVAPERIVEQALASHFDE